MVFKLKTEYEIFCTPCYSIFSYKHAARKYWKLHPSPFYYCDLRVFVSSLRGHLVIQTKTNARKISFLHHSLPLFPFSPLRFIHFSPFPFFPLFSPYIHIFVFLPHFLVAGKRFRPSVGPLVRHFSFIFRHF